MVYDDLIVIVAHMQLSWVTKQACNPFYVAKQALLSLLQHLLVVDQHWKGDMASCLAWNCTCGKSWPAGQLAPTAQLV